MTCFIGLGKTILPSTFIGKTMLGYGLCQHRMQAMKQQPYVRSLLLYPAQKPPDGSQVPFIIIVAEIAFITESLFRETKIICQKLWPAFQESQLLLLAQHTHTNIAGFGEEFIYNIPNGGHDPNILAALLVGIKNCLIAANSNTKPRTLSWNDFLIPNNEKNLAMNRSYHAFLRNKDLKQLSELNCTPAERDTCWDHRSHSWKILDDETFSLHGIINFFGVHCTSMSNRYNFQHTDNKGLAAIELEQETSDFALLAQGASGDISPNVDIFTNAKKRLKDLSYNESLAQKAAKRQSYYIRQSLAQDHFKPIDFKDHKILHAFSRIDMNHVLIDAEYLPENARCNHTVPAAHGDAMAVGAIDGLSGMPLFLIRKICQFSDKWHKVFPVKTLIQNYSYEKYVRGHAPKNIFIHTHFKVLLHPIFKPIISALRFFDPLMRNLAIGLKNGDSDRKWVEHLKPFSFWILGDIAIFSIPFEITVVASLRLERSIVQLLKLKPALPQEVSRVLIIPFANGYSGYITTPEEYDEQAYEGAHTLFGRNSLPAIQTIAKKLVAEI